MTRYMICVLLVLTVFTGTGLGAIYNEHKFVSRKSGKVVGLWSSGTWDGVQAKQQTYTQDEAQLWSFQQMPYTEYYFIKSLKSGKVLGLKDKATTEGTIVELQTLAWYGVQQWKIVPMNNGYVRIVNKVGGRVLSVYNNALNDGAGIVIKEYIGDQGQEWTVSLEKLKVSGDAMMTDNPYWDNKRITLRGAAFRDASRIVTDVDGPGYQFLVDLHASMNASVIRIPCHPYLIGEDIESFLDTYVTPIVMEANKQGMYAIVDYHLTVDATSGNYMTQAHDFWEVAFSRYANWPGVLFQIFNEHNQSDWSALKSVMQPLIDYVRSGSDNIIIVPTAMYNSHLYKCVGDLYLGSNLVYSAHIYPNIYKNWNGSIQPLIANENVPVFVTEWGFNNTLEEGDFRKATVTNYAQPLSELLDSNQMSWTAWCGDILWDLPLFYPDWTLKGGNDFSGEFTAAWLDEMFDIENVR